MSQLRARPALCLAALLSPLTLLSLPGCGESPQMEPPAVVAPQPEAPPAPKPPTKVAPGTWVRVAAGSFIMGTSSGDECRRTENEDRHRVTLTHDFMISATEVTQRQYKEVLGDNPAHAQDCGPDCPMDMISWHRSAAFCNALSSYSELPPCYTCTGSGAELRCVGASSDVYACAGYRLPTEAEWEFAYRAGSDTATYLGNLETCSELDRSMDAIAWFLRNAEGGIHPVAQKRENRLGLYDMSGNVWEWTHDRYQTHLTDATDPVGRADEDLHVLRGGSFNCLPSESRASHRSAIPSTVGALNIGLRCVRTVL